MTTTTNSRNKKEKNEEHRKTAAEELKWPAVPLSPMSGAVPWPPWRYRRLAGVAGVVAAYCCCLLLNKSNDNNTANSTATSATVSALVAAVVWDALLGQIPFRMHPVVLVGRLISRAQKLTPSELIYGSRPVRSFLCGVVLLIATVTLSVASTWIAVTASRAATGYAANRMPLMENAMIGFFPFLLEVMLTKSTLSAQLLCRVASQMANHLERDRVEEGRVQLSWLCSRDASSLRPDELAGGTLESLAENLSDGYVSPLFWYVLACVVCGTRHALLGAVFFRTVNTLDSRVGHRGQFEYYGKASARVDDVLNLAPARITALLLAVAALAVPGCGVRSFRDGIRTAWQDASQCDSPNAGWPMAVMAGALRVQLEKRGQYNLGGAAADPPGPEDIRKGVVITQIAGGLSAALSIAAVYYLDSNAAFSQYLRESSR